MRARARARAARALPPRPPHARHATLTLSCRAPEGARVDGCRGRAGDGQGPRGDVPARRRRADAASCRRRGALRCGREPERDARRAATRVGTRVDRRARRSADDGADARGTRVKLAPTAARTLARRLRAKTLPRTLGTLTPRRPTRRAGSLVPRPRAGGRRPIPAAGEPPVKARPAGALAITGATVTWHGANRSSSTSPPARARAPPTARTGGPPTVAAGSQAPLVYDFHFPSAGGWCDPATGAARSTFGGTVGFSYRDHGIDLRVNDPEVELDGPASRVIFRMTGSRTPTAATAARSSRRSTSPRPPRPRRGQDLHLRADPRRRPTGHGRLRLRRLLPPGRTVRVGLDHVHHSLKGLMRSLALALAAAAAARHGPGRSRRRLHRHRRQARLDDRQPATPPAIRRGRGSATPRIRSARAAATATWSRPRRRRSRARPGRRRHDDRHGVAARHRPALHARLSGRRGRRQVHRRGRRQRRADRQRSPSRSTGCRSRCVDPLITLDGLTGTLQASRRDRVDERRHVRLRPLQDSSSRST